MGTAVHPPPSPTPQGAGPTCTVQNVESVKKKQPHAICWFRYEKNFVFIVKKIANPLTVCVGNTKLYYKFESFFQIFVIFGLMWKFLLLIFAMQNPLRVSLQYSMRVLLNQYKLLLLEWFHWFFLSQVLSPICPKVIIAAIFDTVS
jgi:hypothetical protein